jgi:proline dehydrogenase
MLFRDLILAVAQRRLVYRLVTGLPIFRRMSRRFIAGETLGDALVAIADLRARGIHVTLDHLGESVRDEAMASQATADALAALDRLAREGMDSHLSVKLTQLGLDVSPEFCLGNMRSILDMARQTGAFVRIDMEGSAYTERTLQMYRDLRTRYHNVGVVLQAYLYRSQADGEALASEGADVRLCKGAYSEPASIAYPRKADVDAGFRRIAEVFFRPESLAAGARLAVATHDASIVQWTRLHTMGHEIAADKFQFQMLYGIRRDLQQQLAAQGYRVRVYVPYGAHWYPYFTRRLAERPENLFFILQNLIRG